MVFKNLFQRIQEKNRTCKGKDVSHSKKTKRDWKDCQLFCTEHQKVKWMTFDSTVKYENPSYMKSMYLIYDVFCNSVL